MAQQEDEMTALALNTELVDDGDLCSEENLESFLSGAGMASPVVTVHDGGYLEDLAEGLGATEAAKRLDEDMFMMVDIAFSVRKYRRWRALFPRVKPFFAVKCNPNLMVVRALASLPGCGFDCASIAEMRQVLSNGVSPDRIIFANPCKTPEALSFALNAGVRTMTFDGAEELRKIRRNVDLLKKTAPIPEPQLVLRLRVPDSHSDVPLGEKYGAPEKRCGELMDEAMNLHLQLVGVSFHCGSGCHSVAAYREAIRMAREVFDLAKSKGLRLRLCDIGGGFPGFDGSEPGCTPTPSILDEGAEGPLTCAHIAAEIVPLLDEVFPPSEGVQIISEPGRYFVEGGHVLFTQLYAKRMVDAKSGATGSGGKRMLYFVGEGVHGCFKDALLCGESFRPHVLSKDRIHEQATLLDLPRSVSPMSPPLSSSGDGSQTSEGMNDTTTTANGEKMDSAVMGPSGERFDCIVSSVRLPPLQVGDWLFFTRMGAYTTSIASANSSVYLDQDAYCYIATRPPPILLPHDQG